ncbi:MAG: hypothetical protein KGV44_12430 [Flavobacteriaceae bacterium]|nr:hypothetical protein [Flavobacteriaceae bacterium]MBS9768325.1 hypothetical protein [Flavobacteriaceae bacterium]
MERIKLTSEWRETILKALKAGTISRNVLAEFCGGNRGKYYDNFNMEDLSEKARKEVEDATIQPEWLQLSIDRELKVLLLKTLNNFFIEVKDFEKYGKVEHPLFRKMDLSKLSEGTKQEIEISKRNRFN